jgi:hypothetical protein
MKKIGIFVISMIIFGLLFNGCASTKTSEAGARYYYEIFRVSINNYNSAEKPLATYESILAFKESLKEHLEEFYGFGSDGTHDDIYTLLTQRGITPQDADNYISVINSIGNNLFAFNYVDDNRFYVIIYLEKL